MNKRLTSLCASLAILAGGFAVPHTASAATLTFNESGQCIEGLTAQERQRIQDQDKNLRFDTEWYVRAMQYLADQNSEFQSLVENMQKSIGFLETLPLAVGYAAGDDVSIDDMEKYSDAGLFASRRETAFHKAHMNLLGYLERQGFSERGARDIAALWFETNYLLKWDRDPDNYLASAELDLAPFTSSDAEADIEKHFRKLGMDDESDRNRLLELLVAEDYEATRNFVIEVNKQRGKDGKRSRILGLIAEQTDKDRAFNEFVLEQYDPYNIDNDLLRIWQYTHCISGMEGEGNILGVNNPPAGLDSDNDGLLDEWEIAGVTPDGVLLPNADPMRKDIYIQLNWMSPRTKEGTRALNRLSEIQAFNNLMPSLEEQDDASFLVFGFDTTAGKSMKPTQKTIDIFRQFFDILEIDDFSADGVKQGINIHIDADDLSTDDFGDQAAGGETLDYRAWYQAVGEDFHAKMEAEPSGMSDARKKYFYQMFAVDLVEPRPKSAGRAALPGNYSMIAMGHRFATEEYLAETMAHELGHNLGLGHAGAIDVKVGPGSTRVSRDKLAHENDQRRYRSIMNYTYGGLGVDGDPWYDPDRTAAGDDWEGNRFRHEFVADGDSLIIGASNRNYNRLVAGRLLPAPEPIIPDETEYDPKTIAENMDLPAQANVLFSNPEVIEPTDDGLNVKFVVENLSKADEDFDVEINLGNRTITKKLSLTGRGFEEVSIPLALDDITDGEVSLTVSVAGKEHTAVIPVEVPEGYEPPAIDEGSSEEDKTLLTVLLSILGIGGIIAAIVAAIPHLKNLLP